MSEMEFSRARTTRFAPSRLRAKRTPSALVIVICVEQWIGKSGERARIIRQTPTSCTIAASTPASIIARA